MSKEILVIVIYDDDEVECTYYTDHTFVEREVTNKDHVYCKGDWRVDKNDKICYFTIQNEQWIEDQYSKVIIKAMNELADKELLDG